MDTARIEPIEVGDIFVLDMEKIRIAHRGSTLWSEAFLLERTQKFWHLVIGKEYEVIYLSPVDIPMIIDERSIRATLPVHLCRRVSKCHIASYFDDRLFEIE